LKTISEQLRSKILAKKKADAFRCLWDSSEECGQGPDVCLDESIASPQLEKRFKDVYKLLSKDLEAYMPLFRATLQRVCMELNSREWSQFFHVKDDFVIVPADGSQFFRDEFDDISKSMSPERLKLLQSKGFLGSGQRWDHRPGYVTYPDGGHAERTGMLQEIKDRTNEMPVVARIAYWVDQLDKFAAAETCDMTRIEETYSYPVVKGALTGHLAQMVLDHIAEIESDDVGVELLIPLLELADKWADKPERDSRDFTTRGAKVINTHLLITVFRRLMGKVEDRENTYRQIESLLRSILEKSCRANEGRSYWGFRPTSVAERLHEFFNRYPEPKLEGFVLANRDDFFRVPLP
jgi:hypothetical protein